MSEDGELGRVSVGSDGHLYVGPDRVRFWGINCTFEACFPTHGQAEAVAKWLRKFGFNAMRLTHLDPPWGRLLVDYQHPDGTSQHFDEQILDRLDYFIYQLQSQGIYIDLNLHVSRHYTEADGISGFVGPDEGFDEDAMQLEKTLAIFNTDAQQLDKDYATALLQHENPYTGRVYATDPGIAFVEILNEAGMIHAALSGYFERMPQQYQDQLQLLWNEWLQNSAGYADTTELQTAWGNASARLQLLGDTNFDQLAQGSGPWTAEVLADAAANVDVVLNADGSASAVVIDTTTTQAEEWKVALWQTVPSLQEGQTYTLSLRVRGDAGRRVHWNLVDQATFTSLDDWRTATLTEDWVQLTHTFIADAQDAAIGELRLEIGGLAASLGEVWVAQPSLLEGGEPFSSGQTLEAVTVPLLDPAVAWSAAAKRDWLSFLRGVDDAYFSEMRRFVKQELGVQSLVIGTTSMNSPPSIQSQFDIMDTHFYWSHPVFPGELWDPVDWRVDRSALVDHPPGMVADVAGVTVQGKPQFVTEFNDSEPNPLAGNSALLVGAYGSLQDWDGVFLFDIGPTAQQYTNWFLQIASNPRKLANQLLGARMFRGFEIAAANQELSIAYDAITELDTMVRRAGPWDVAHANHLGIPLHATLLSALRLDVAAGAVSSPLPDLDGVTGFESDTGQLVWDVSDPERGVVTVTAPRVRAVTGHTDGGSFNLQDVTIEPGTTRAGHSTVALALLEGQSFLEDGRALITATGTQENTGQVWTDATQTSVGDQWGGPPTLIETIGATITLARPADEVRVWALDPGGQRGAELAVSGTTSASFTLGSSIPTLWYELELGQPSSPAPSEELMQRCEAFCAAPDPDALACFADNLTCQAWCLEDHASASAAVCGCENAWFTALDCVTENAAANCDSTTRFDSEGACAAAALALQQCRALQEPCIAWDHDLIDDFEDADDQIVETRGRHGAWFWTSSGDGSLSAPEPSTGGAQESSWAMYASGTRGQWAHLDVTLNDSEAYDASPYAGLGFYAKGSGELSVQIFTKPIEQAQAWGQEHQQRIELSDDWAYQVVRFDAEGELAQPMGSQPIELDPSQLVAVYFAPIAPSFDFAIDELSFLVHPDTPLSPWPEGEDDAATDDTTADDVATDDATADDVAADDAATDDVATDDVATDDVATDDSGDEVTTDEGAGPDDPSAGDEPSVDDEPTEDQAPSGRDGGADDGTPGEGSGGRSGGCGCRAVGAAEVNGRWLWLLVAASVWRRRRQTTRGATTPID